MTIRQEQFLLRAFGIAPLAVITGVSLSAMWSVDPKKSDMAVTASSLRHQMVADKLHDALRADVPAAIQNTDSRLVRRS